MYVRGKGMRPAVDRTRNLYQGPPPVVLHDVNSALMGSYDRIDSLVLCLRRRSDDHHLTVPRQ